MQGVLPLPQIDGRRPSESGPVTLPVDPVRLTVATSVLENLGLGRTGGVDTLVRRRRGTHGEAANGACAAMACRDGKGPGWPDGDAAEGPIGVERPRQKGRAKEATSQDGVAAWGDDEAHRSAGLVRTHQLS